MRRYGLLIILMVLIIVSLVRDYQSYELDEADTRDDMTQIIKDRGTEDLTRVTIEDIITRPGGKFYFGEVEDALEYGVFAIGYKKHWISGKYREGIWIFTDTREGISKTKGVEIDYFFRRYKAFYMEVPMKPVVEDSISGSFILSSSVLMMSAFNALRFARKKST